ncbi:MAG: hypothetical protein K9J16_00810 [Melioribacteraceae bacterium]|nr:hypothetical protein [Melioribacteraceae bacterium]MCF8356366.1 hypothetical protein [Melioribacteraceae bacterium]MCF8392266.1 hypothetical protein [Melioribacteraceae bacterium]MCF8417598.1 hypothetical protein [Melioribacteraceae bacterium]
MKKTLVLIFISIILSLTISAQSYKYESPNGRVDMESLSGEWSFIKCDPITEIVESREGSFDPPKYSPSLEEVIPEDARENPYKFIPTGLYQMVNIPSAWEQFTGIDFNGTGWFSKDLHIDINLLKQRKSFWLEFDAVATAAGVWINGKWVGGNVGDYNRWSVEISKFAKPGKNEILVYVDELPAHIFQGFLSVIAPHHGGIWQDVKFYSTNEVFIKTDGVFFRTDINSGSVTAEVLINGDFASANVEPQIIIGEYNSNYKKQIQNEIEIESFDLSENENGFIFSFNVNDFKLWNPDSPNLYYAKIDLIDRKNVNVTDSYFQTFGFREVKIDGSDLFLNGEKLNLRSVLNWGFYPRVVSPAPPVEIIQDEFEYVKSLGLNSETICLMVMPDYFYELADELGVLIWEEYPTWHNEFTEQQLEAYRKSFPAFFMRDRNHPSIILRSMSVEAGVKDKSVMKEIVKTAREMTDTPIQDNSSWFWLSDLEITDWYGEDNYWNNNRWAQHMLINLPNQLDALDPKPYIIGESIAGSNWIDIEAHSNFDSQKPLMNYLSGTDDAHDGKNYPYWFPISFEASLEVEKKLRARYNDELSGKDIVKDYLIPQSEKFARAFREFQLRLLYADPRYTGWTLFILRDHPNITSGIIDNFGNRRFTPQNVPWLNNEIKSPVVTSEVDGSKNVPLIDQAPGLLKWNDSWGYEIQTDEEVYVLSEGYSDLNPLFDDWKNKKNLEENDLERFFNQNSKSVLAATLLTYDMIDYMENGGAVILFSSRWPGAFDGKPKMLWSGAYFAPPVGPLSDVDENHLIDLMQYDLIHSKAEGIPVAENEIEDYLDPMIRIYENHGIEDVIPFDLLTASKVGDGLLVVTSLDHSAEAGQWLLGKTVSFMNNWLDGKDKSFPKVEFPAGELKDFGVRRINSIISLNERWKFITDPDEEGEKNGYEKVDFNDSDWKLINAASIWENQGYRYDGMAWYRKVIDLPENVKDKNVTLVAEGVDDAYRLFINGNYAAMHGSFTDHNETVFVTKTETDITEFIQPGKNTIVLQVFDITGGGGIGRPIYLRIE